ncbi:MAG: outer membrane protein transport protein [Mariprofundaceae bacterium]|nr:outer membrane protein transport protein [Mariprofundaceae bacterium]
MNNQWKAWSASIPLCVAIMAGGTAVNAAGFANQDFSISGVGTANAVIAGVYDASAASYNPAAIAWGEGLNIQVNSNGRFRNNSVKVPTGVWPNLANAPDAVSTNITWMPHGSNFGLGLSLGTPFHNSTIWSPGMPNVPDSWLRVRRATFDIVYAATSTLSMAYGLDVYRAKTLMTQGLLSFSAKDKSSFGGHASFNWKIAPLWRMGLMLRKAPRLQLTANNNELRLDLPDQIGLGISHDQGNAVRWELDTEWSRWSALKDMSVRAINTGAVLMAAPASLRDTISIKAGMTWFWRRDTAFRFGYAYDQGANKKSAFQPMISDQAGHRLSLGFGGEMFGMNLDVAYSYAFYSKLKVSGTYAGEYRDRQTTLGVALSKAF